MTVHYQTEGPIAIITLDRPEVRNAVDRPTAAELAAASAASKRITRSPLPYSPAPTASSVPAPTLKR